MYYGVASQYYTNQIHVAGLSHTNVTVVLPKQNVNYFFAVTAGDKNGLESDLSTEWSYFLPITSNTVTISWAPSTTNKLYSSPDLKVWSLIGTVLPPFTKSRDKQREFFAIRP